MEGHFRYFDRSVFLMKVACEGTRAKRSNQHEVPYVRLYCGEFQRRLCIATVLSQRAPDDRCREPFFCHGPSLLWPVVCRLSATNPSHSPIGILICCSRKTLKLARTAGCWISGTLFATCTRVSDYYSASTTLVSLLTIASKPRATKPPTYFVSPSRE